jgi:putative transcriptional regulator
MKNPEKKSPSSSEELGLKLLQSVREMKAKNFARVTQVAVNEVVDARQSAGMSQAEFALALHISKRTLQEWEQGRRSPSGAAQALVRIAKRHPEVLRESLASPSVQQTSFAGR